MNKIKVGVYGTLKEGHALAHYLGEAKRLPNRVLHGWKMYNLGWYPGIRPNSPEEEKEALEVEVYEVSPSMLTTLDQVEGVPSLYRRVQVDDLFIYVYNEPIDEAKRIKSNVWE